MNLREFIDKRLEEMGKNRSYLVNECDIEWSTLSSINRGAGIRESTREKLALALHCSQGEIQACLAEQNPLKDVVVSNIAKAKMKANRKKKEPKEEPEEELPFDDLPEPEPDAVANAVMAETEAYNEPEPEKKVPVKKEAIMKEPEGMVNYLKNAADDIEKALDKVGDAAVEAMASITKGISLGILPADDTLDDTVNHPAHYTQGAVECIEAIKASMTASEFRGYLKGNAMKYIWRYQHKGGVEDLKKARWYLDRLIGEVDR